MTDWKKTSLLTTLIILLLFIGAMYVLNLSISGPSSNIEFAPEQEVSTNSFDSVATRPKNIILVVADGMGFSHLSLAMMTLQKDGEPSVWQQFNVKGWHNTRSIIGPLTDSEASATAMATGTSTNFGHIGIDNDGNKLQNVFELASVHQYNTGIVTDSYIWDGTPAAFVAHTRNEDDARDIMTQMAMSDLDLLFGELEDLGEDGVPEKDETLAILSKRFQLLDSDMTLPSNSSQPIAAIFEEDEIQDLSSTPNLTQLTNIALSYLSSNEQPFMLLVECEEMDSASHTNDSDRVLNGLRSLQETLAHILNFSKENGETLVVFTADHETGGLAAVADFDEYPQLQIKWATKNHTAAVVPLFADGPGAENFSAVTRNWEIGKLLKSLVESE